MHSQRTHASNTPCGWMPFSLQLLPLGANVHLNPTPPIRPPLCTHPTHSRITDQIQRVANVCCEGRVISCLEGGYGRVDPGIPSASASATSGAASASASRSESGGVRSSAIPAACETCALDLDDFVRCCRGHLAALARRLVVLPTARRSIQRPFTLLSFHIHSLASCTSFHIDILSSFHANDSSSFYLPTLSLFRPPIVTSFDLAVLLFHLLRWDSTGTWGSAPGKGISLNIILHPGALRLPPLLLLPPTAAAASENATRCPPLPRQLPGAVRVTEVNHGRATRIHPVSL